MDRDSKQILQDLRRKVTLVNDQMSLIKDGFERLSESFTRIEKDFGLFIDLYEKEQDEVKARLKRLEDHIGLGN